MFFFCNGDNFDDDFGVFVFDADDVEGTTTKEEEEEGKSNNNRICVETRLLQKIQNDYEDFWNCYSEDYSIHERIELLNIDDANDNDSHFNNIMSHLKEL